MLKLVLMLRSKKVDGLRAITSNYKGEPKLKLIFLVYFLWVITKTHFTATFLLHFMNHLKVNESRHKYCGVTHPLNRSVDHKKWNIPLTLISFRFILSNDTILNVVPSAELQSSDIQEENKKSFKHIYKKEDLKLIP